MRKWVVVLGIVFIAVLILAGAWITWGPYHGLDGADWLRFWGGIIAPLVLGTTASVAAGIAWMTLRQNREADMQRYERERRAEFWDRLGQAIELATSSDLIQASLGTDLLSYVYTDLNEQGEATTQELELIKDVLATVQPALDAARQDQEQAHRDSSLNVRSVLRLFRRQHVAPRG